MSVDIEPPEWLHDLIREWEPDDPQDVHDGMVDFAWDRICAESRELPWCDVHHRVAKECDALRTLGATSRDGDCHVTTALVLGVTQAPDEAAS